MLVVSFMMSSSELQIFQLSREKQHHGIISSWRPVADLGVALHLVEAWKFGRGRTVSTSRLLLPPGFVLCLFASGT